MNNEILPTITVDDTNLIGENWTSTHADANWPYTQTFECSDDPSDYVNGFYTYKVTNTATIVETKVSDSADVTVNCYAPIVSKTAAGTYDEVHDWTILKTVDPSHAKRFCRRDEELHLDNHSQ